MTTTVIGRVVAVGLTLGLASTAHAQTSDRRWSVDFGIGWDNSVSGNINSSTIGSANGQTVVVLTNKYEEVYGTGLHFRVGGGYKLNPSDRGAGDLDHPGARRRPRHARRLRCEPAVRGLHGLREHLARFWPAPLRESRHHPASVRRRLDRHRVHQRDRRRARGAASQPAAQTRTTSTRTRPRSPGRSRAGCSGRSRIASRDSRRLVCAT